MIDNGESFSLCVCFCLVIDGFVNYSSIRAAVLSVELAALSVKTSQTKQNLLPIHSNLKEVCQNISVTKAFYEKMKENEKRTFSISYQTRRKKYYGFAEVAVMFYSSWSVVYCKKILTPNISPKILLEMFH